VAGKIRRGLETDTKENILKFKALPRLMILYTVDEKDDNETL
jgi:hypothetical protein